MSNEMKLSKLEIAGWIVVGVGTVVLVSAGLMILKG
jgi:hypothetical protein